ncbi:MAG: acyltransferase [Deltaproteobacteria bacterium]|nr:acyltransferase [Deltaproteobacteria bacterium]
MLRVGFFQFAPKFGQVATNLSKIVSALRGSKADIIVLPELAFTGYFFQDRSELASLAEDPSKSPTVSSLIALCRDSDFFLVTGFAERSAEKIFNSALLVGGDGVLHTYRKLHLFNTEKEYFDPGDTPLETIELRGARIGIMVCFDWVFPEVARVLALQGADILCHPSNLVLTYCQQAMRTRCLENSVFAVTTNRCGSDIRPRGALTFTGQSQMVAPEGELIYSAKPDGEELFIAEIDVSKARDKWMTQRNELLRDRRPEYYTDLIETTMTKKGPGR